MKRSRACWLLLACGAGYAQQFDVASVKPVDPESGGRFGSSGGPGTSDPERITYSVFLQSLLMTAYGVGSDQISGPDWLQRERYEIVAKVPPGATKEQANVMLQNLLAERFHVSLHRVMKEFPEYSLVVAKGGRKLKESADPNIPMPKGPSSLDDIRSIKTGANGFPQLPPGMRMAGVRRDGVSYLSFRAYSISDLVEQLRLPLGKITGGMWATGRISDKTGLTGKYDFTLEFAGSMAPGGAFVPLAGGQVGPDLFEALEKQLGLKLEKSKALLDVLVIDHADRVPTGN
jgi:uncharacterized protein (TIGR03435 family)